MIYIYNEFLYRPLLNLLIMLYNLIPDLGIAIILLTLFIRLLLLPLFYKSSKDQTIMQKHVMPKIKDIQKKHKDNKEKQAKEMMAVYKEHNVSPFSGFLLIIVQLPILIALYRVFLNDFSKSFSNQLYHFVSVPGVIHTTFLGLINLGTKNMWIVFIAVIFQYLQSKFLFSIKKKSNDVNKKKDKHADIIEKTTKGMIFFGPFITFLILSQLPSAVALYWVTTSIFSTVQQIIINKQLEKYDGRRTKDSRTTDIANGV